jgi:outer membrane immunogenic protein
MNMKIIVAATAALFSTSTFAADLISPAPVATYEPAAVMDWSGFYAGVFGGVTTGDSDFSIVPVGGPSVFDLSTNAGGGVVGVQIGADAQFDQFVLGAVADIAYTNHGVDLSFAIPALGGASADISSQLNYLGTLRARAGLLVQDNLLAYVHGGLAYGQTEQSLTFGGVVIPGLGTQDRWGYTLGAGIEYAINDQISLQTEYAYTHFDSEDIFVAPGVGALTEALSFHTVKAGLNFHF